MGRQGVDLQTAERRQPTVHHCGHRQLDPPPQVGLRAHLIKIKLEEMVPCDALSCRLGHLGLSLLSLNLCRVRVSGMLAGLDFLPGDGADDFRSLFQPQLVQSSPMQSMASLESLEQSSRMTGGSCLSFCIRLRGVVVF